MTNKTTRTTLLSNSVFNFAENMSVIILYRNITINIVYSFLSFSKSK